MPCLEASGEMHTRASGPGGSPDTRTLEALGRAEAGAAGKRACTYGTFWRTISGTSEPLGATNLGKVPARHTNV